MPEIPNCEAIEIKYEDANDNPESEEVDGELITWPSLFAESVIFEPDVRDRESEDENEMINMQSINNDRKEHEITETEEIVMPEIPDHEKIDIKHEDISGNDNIESASIEEELSEPPSGPHVSEILLSKVRT